MTKPVSEWVEERFIDIERHTRRVRVALEAAVERPVFVDGSEGYAQVKVLLRVGDRFLRLDPDVWYAVLDVIKEATTEITIKIDDLEEQRQRTTAVALKRQRSGR